MQSAVPEQINYLNKAVAIVDHEIKRSKTKAVDFKTLANAFQKEFPSYDLAYMIEYGAYGLVQQRSSVLQK